MADFTFDELTPTSYLRRAARVFADRDAIVDGDRRYSYEEWYERSLRLAGALAALGISPGDRVAALCVNSHVMLELHHGVPLAGGVMVPLNTRLSEAELAYCVTHSGASVLVATHELEQIARAVSDRTGVRLIVAGGEREEYEDLLASASPLSRSCPDERSLLSINYTSGTTGNPKGVMLHHRGAYLQAMAMAYHAGLTPSSRYLWTLPMFHCHGWCFVWAVGAAGGSHLCLRAIVTAEIWRLLREESVTHYSAAPTVLTMIATASEAANSQLPHRIHVDTGGAPPTPTLLARLDGLNMDVTHLYGLTETFGPIAINQWKPEWSTLPGPDQARLKARQGVGNVIASELRVVDESGKDVPADSETTGEIVCRGNDVMLGYYAQDDATDDATIDGHFKTGDLGVMHPDGYIEIRDRAKDIIISGGENIASVEVERVLDTHPDVMESAVVGQPDGHWGEIPVAFVTPMPGRTPDESELIEYVRQRIAHFKAPKRVILGDLAKTSTGKIQKAELRRRLANKSG